jgi:hypothetical protein
LLRAAVLKEWKKGVREGLSMSLVFFVFGYKMFCVDLSVSSFCLFLSFFFFGRLLLALLFFSQEKIKRGAEDEGKKGEGREERFEKKGSSDKRKGVPCGAGQCQTLILFSAEKKEEK